MGQDYAMVFSQFWTGETGRMLRRGGRDAQVLALYLITCQSANSIGLYHLALPTLCHETGLSPQGASKALRCLSDGAFSEYDAETETVWVPNMARHQIGGSLKPSDKRTSWVKKEIEK